MRQQQRLVAPGLVLVLAAMTSAGLFAAMPHQGLPLFALLASLLPLQLAAVLWVVARPQRGRAVRAAAPPTARWTPPASG